MFPCQRAVFDALRVQRIEILVGTPQTVGEESEAVINALDGFFKRLSWIAWDVVNIFCYPQKSCLAVFIGTFFGFCNTEIPILFCAAEDAADDHFHCGKEPEFFIFAQMFFSGFIDFFDVTG